MIEDAEETSIICHVEVDMPDNKKELKKFTRDSETWVSNRLKKQAEVKWKDIPANKVEDFKKAMSKEVTQWIKQGAVKLFRGKVPAERLMRMRWVYATKQDHSCKARIVLIGFEDPDLGEMVTSSPTMSRRTRGLFLTACAHFGWTALTGDVKSAFLQGAESEEERDNL